MTGANKKRLCYSTFGNPGIETHTYSHEGIFGKS